MIGWWTTNAIAGEAKVEAVLGGRTSPDAALEQPFEWEPEIEPSGLAAVTGAYRSTGDPGWWGVQGALLGVVPEPDASYLGVGPRVGVGIGSGAARLEAAARYDAQLYPWSFEATNGRAEGLVSGALDGRTATETVAVVAIDREYVQAEWSFRSVEPCVALELHTVDRGARVRLTTGWQLNQGYVLQPGGGRLPVLGDQLRLAAELGASAGRIDLWSAYRLIASRGGGTEGATRPVFTPVGAYSEDADALSAGGFLQHRVSAGLSAESGPWRFGTSALGRLRTGTGGTEAVDRTLHGQLDLARETGEHTSVVAALGASGARLVGGASYLDLYGWAGLAWEP